MAAAGSGGGSCATPDFNSIQAAVDAAAAGDTIVVCPGTYVEDVRVTTQVTIAGTDRNSVIVEPATSGPICSGGSLCNDANVFLVVANGVRITNLTVEGDNPGLTSGVAVGGSDLDARNGIITDHRVGTWNDLTVDHVTVRDIYLRGIYASSGGTFDFHDNTVSNVQGEYASIAIFNFRGSGTFARNTVSHAGDAISSNWSTGVQFLDNVVTDSGSGVHTDNSSGHDVIAGNHIACGPDGYGVFVFVPYTPTDVHDNSIAGCAVGLGAFGGNGGATTFAGNRVDGAGLAGSIGAWVSTTTFGYGDMDVAATLTGNTVVRNGTGVSVDDADPASATVAMHGNVLAGNGTGLSSTSSVAVDATDNWWGCSQDPATTTACNGATGNATTRPWLVDHVTVAPTVAAVDTAITGTVDLTWNSDDVQPGVTVPDGTTVSFGAGSSGPSGSGVTSGGSATVSIATGSAPDVYSVCGHVPATYGTAEGCTPVAIYDPSSGFVTGGGWIDSPAGAEPAAPDASGRADFAFTSRYAKGASVPSGHTAFMFRTGNLDFASTAYQWLVIAGTKAQFRGTGTVNGAGSYTFQVKAIDGGNDGPDTFRIQIWDSGGGVLYDNGADTPIGGGSIIVHS